MSLVWGLTLCLKLKLRYTYRRRYGMSHTATAYQMWLWSSHSLHESREMLRLLVSEEVDPDQVGSQEKSISNNRSGEDVVCTSHH